MQTPFCAKSPTIILMCVALFLLRSQLSAQSIAQSIAQSDSVVPETTAKDWANKGIIEDIGLADEPKVLWKYERKKPWYGGMTVFDGVLAAIERNKGIVIGLDTTSGKRLWETSLGPSFSYGMGIIMTCDPEFDAVIIGCDSGLVALDRKTGRSLWHYRTETGVDGPTIAAGRVIAGGSDGSVHAVDLKTGKPQWNHDYMADAPEDPEGFDGERARFEGRPARPQEASTDGETVFLSIFDQCRTLAIDAKTGERRWTFQSKGWMGSRPTVTADSVYVASQDQHFYALDKQTGNVQWSIKAGKWNSSPPAVSDRLVVFGSNDGNVYAILREMGSPVWEYDVTEGGKRRGSLYSRPLISDGVVYQLAMNGTVHAIDLETGQKEWMIEPSRDSEIASDPHFDHGQMFFFTRNKTGKVEDRQEILGENAIISIGRSK